MYAIRFLPIDPRDPSPALYLSTDTGARVTSVAEDIWSTSERPSDRLVAWVTQAGGVSICKRERLRADVVSLVEALRDLEAT